MRHNFSKADKVQPAGGEVTENTKLLVANFFFEFRRSLVLFSNQITHDAEHFVVFGRFSEEFLGPLENFKIF